ncbi:MAG: orotidine 5'-phosphate decarboxylase / HUMPS family protein, partial [Candidatus Altiarchaeota archaeon]
VKAEGVGAIEALRDIAPDAFIVADLKTMDTGQVEVDMAFNETADGVVCAGQAPLEVIEKFIYEARRVGILSFLDLIGVEDPIKLLKKLKDLPDVVELHRAIDEEDVKKPKWELIPKIRATFPKKKFLVAVAGGIEPDTTAYALKQGADIIIVGRYITQSKDIERSTRNFINLLQGDIDLKRIHTE